MMRNTWVCFAGILFFIIPFTTAFAGVTAEPAVLVFHSTDESVIVQLMTDGAPLSPENMTGWRLLVDTSNYSHMLRVTPVAEGLRITPSDTVEVGSYLLAIDTKHGAATVQVFTPLTDYQSSIEALADRMNISIDEVRRQTGLSQRMAREQVTLGLLPVYYLGQRIRVEMPGAENRLSIWKINGETVLEGVGARRLDHVMETTGLVLAAYEERENEVVVATATALTEVVAEPAIPHEVNVNARARFEAPPGFADHAWRVDGNDAGIGDAFEHVFSAPGQYEVMVASRTPTAPGPYAFRETRYAVTVLP